MLKVEVMLVRCGGMKENTTRVNSHAANMQILCLFTFYLLSSSPPLNLPHIHWALQLSIRL